MARKIIECSVEGDNLFPGSATTSKNNVPIFSITLPLNEFCKNRKLEISIFSARVKLNLLNIRMILFSIARKYKSALMGEFRLCVIKRNKK